MSKRVITDLEKDLLNRVQEDLVQLRLVGFRPVENHQFITTLIVQVQSYLHELLDFYENSFDEISVSLIKLALLHSTNMFKLTNNGFKMLQMRNKYREDFYIVDNLLELIIHLEHMQESKRF